MERSACQWSTNYSCAKLPATQRKLYMCIAQSSPAGGGLGERWSHMTVTEPSAEASAIWEQSLVVLELVDQSAFRHQP